MAKIESIFVKSGDITSFISRYCPECGYDRNCYSSSMLKFALSFADKFICKECKSSEEIIKMRGVKDQDIELKMPEVSTLDYKLRTHGLVLFQITDPSEHWYHKTHLKEVGSRNV